MKLLGIDIETGNSFDEKERGPIMPTEVGAVLWDTDYNAPVQVYSSLVLDKEETRNVSPEAKLYTGISTGMLQEHGISAKLVQDDLLALAQKADFLVAHNARQAEMPWLNEWFKYPRSTGPFGIGRWIDTMTDVEYPENCVARSLIYLNGFHGFCNPFPHRAVTDVLSMFMVLNKYPLERVIQVARSPLIKYQACVGIQDKDLARNARFQWNPDAKVWHKDIKRIFIDEGKVKFPFKIKELQNLDLQGSEGVQTCLLN